MKTLFEINISEKSYETMLSKQRNVPYIPSDGVSLQTNMHLFRSAGNMLRNVERPGIDLNKLNSHSAFFKEYWEL